MTIKPSKRLKAYIRSKPVPWSAADRNAVMLAFWGLTTKGIASHTGLSENQVNYRLSRLGVAHYRREYRLGTSIYARAVLHNPGQHGVGSVVSRKVEAHTNRTRGENDYANKKKAS